MHNATSALCCTDRNFSVNHTNLIKNGVKLKNLTSRRKEGKGQTGTNDYPFIVDRTIDMSVYVPVSVFVFVFQNMIYSSQTNVEVT